MIRRARATTRSGQGGDAARRNLTVVRVRSNDQKGGRFASISPLQLLGSMCQIRCFRCPSRLFCHRDSEPLGDPSVLSQRHRHGIVGNRLVHVDRAAEADRSSDVGQINGGRWVSERQPALSRRDDCLPPIRAYRGLSMQCLDEPIRRSCQRRSDRKTFTQDIHQCIRERFAVRILLGPPESPRERARGRPLGRYCPRGGGLARRHQRREQPSKAEVRDFDPFGRAIGQRQRYRREDKKRIGFPLLPHWRCYSPMILISTRLRRPPSNSP